MTDKLLNITFKSHSEQGLEEYMVAQKVGYFLRKIAKNLTIYETLTQDGDTFTYKFESTFKNHTMTFKLGEPFVDHGIDGRDMKTTFNVEGDTLVATQENINEGDVPCRSVRRLMEDGNLEITFTSVPTDTVCKRIFVVHKKL
ncbi:fatty acid-binding-like protein 5 [Plakobranchus ocellatus]|uniref:Fatty acid-binding-like protein 5 n=1 Tax=Plakobranchus ocellatus TaxID=259542 RepID=A0AAV4E1L1_9GAST|nr:fatty acid-binding-like protein 5 [Plakobranchus ocellatus]